MDSAKLNDWLQVIGIFALVASLIFVGLQMKQTHEIALASQYQDRAESTLELFRTMMETDRADFQVAGVPRENWTMAEHTYSFAFISHLWLMYDNHHYQYSSGYLSDESWAGLETRIQSHWQDCDSRWIYENFFKHSFRASFNTYLLALDDPCVPEDSQRPAIATNPAPQP